MDSDNVATVALEVDAEQVEELIKHISESFDKITVAIQAVSAVLIRTFASLHTMLLGVVGSIVAAGAEMRKMSESLQGIHTLMMQTIENNQGITSVTEFIEKLNHYTELVNFLTESLKTINSEEAPWFYAALGIAALISAIAAIVIYWDEIVAFITKTVSDVIAYIQEKTAPMVAWFSQLFGNIGQSISDVFHNIGVMISGCWNILDAWTEDVGGIWDTIFDGAQWAIDGIVGLFKWLGENIGKFISGAWDFIIGLFSPDGNVFDEIGKGIADMFKNLVNKLIDGINAIIKKPYDGINAALLKLKGTEILGFKPFEELRPIAIPTIPHLAKGAVLPANRPFLAVVGDQRHGTNVEAPLATIQEAVGLVMNDHISAMMAGFRALLEEQQATRRTIEGIEIGDRVIGEAAQRYQRKMAVTYGTF